MRLVFVVAATALVACANPLDLPSAPLTGPVIKREPEPPSAFAGQRVVIEGAGFNPDPSRNVVQFAGARAIPVSASQDRLEVIVPADAGTGPVVVSTPEGPSAPVSFTYLGFGHPRRGVETGRSTYVFSIDWMGVVGGQTFAYALGVGALFDPSMSESVRLPPACEGCTANDVVMTAPVIARGAEPGGDRLLLQVRDGSFVTYRPGDPPAIAVVAERSREDVTYLESPMTGSRRLWRHRMPEDPAAPALLEVLDAQTFAVVAGPLPVSRDLNIVPVDDTRTLGRVRLDESTLRWELIDLERSTSVGLPSLEYVERVVVASGPTPSVFAFDHSRMELTELMLGDPPLAVRSNCPVPIGQVWNALALRRGHEMVVVAALLRVGPGRRVRSRDGPCSLEL